MLKTHSDGINVAYCDGHVKWVKSEKAHSTKANVTTYLPWAIATSYPPGY